MRFPRRLVSRALPAGGFLALLAGSWLLAAQPGETPTTVSRPPMKQRDAGPAALAKEVRTKGWIVYSKRASNGTWDLFRSRPDGSRVQPLTETAEFEEAAPRYSPDGAKLLYRQLKRGTVVNHDQWGFQGQLIISDSNGSNPIELGAEGELPWASWSPDGRQVACLTKKEIQVVDIDTKIVSRTLPRRGIYQQLTWSPDGDWFCGVANFGNEMWTVVRMSAKSGEVNAVQSFQNCTPDWFPKSDHILFSSRPANQQSNQGYGWTELWRAPGDGGQASLLYGEEGFHIYGGALSPDGSYLLFTKTATDGGGSESAGGSICLMRLADTPALAGESPEKRVRYPRAKTSAVLTLGEGWEPSWTYSKRAGRKP